MAIYPHELKRALHQCRRGQGLWSWSCNATCNPARTQERYQGSAAVDSRERVVTRLRVMPLTGSPSQSACRMVLRLLLLWTSAYTDVRVLLRALPAGFHLTTIGRLGPSPVERVDRVICLNNHHRAAWSQPRCAESIPGFSREGQCPVATCPHKLKHAVHRCRRGLGLELGLQCDVRPGKSAEPCTASCYGPCGGAGGGVAPGIWDTEESMALRKGRRSTTVPLVVYTWVRRVHCVR